MPEVLGNFEGKRGERLKKISQYNFRIWWLLPALFILAVVIFLTRYPSDRDTLKVFYHAGPNVIELMKTLDHYRNHADPLKYEAARFLIRNMDLHYFREDEYSDYKINWLAGNLDRVKTRIAGIDDSLEIAWEPLRSENEVIKIRDARRISAGFLISHIDQAFEVWNHSPWNDRYNFEQFCQYFLPYKPNEAKPELWLDHYKNKYEKYTGILDKSVDLKQLLSVLYDSAYSKVTNHSLKVRRHLSPLEMERVPVGDCRFDSNWLGMISRSLGMPVADIYTPYWANAPGGHFWNAWMDSTGGWEEFTLRYQMRWVVNWISAPPKVFIRLWGKHDRSLPSLAKKEGIAPGQIPENLYIWNIEDVTKHFIPSSDITLELDPPPTETKFAYLAIYRDRDWIPVYWARVHDNTATFVDMGRRAFYKPVYFFQGKCVKAGAPFYLDSHGSVFYPESDTSYVVELEIDRSYPMRAYLMEEHGQQLLGSTFEGSLSSDFSSIDTLYCITDSIKWDPELNKQLRNKLTKDHWYQDIPITSNKKYRFIRYRSSKEKISPIGDMEVFNMNGLKLLPDSIYGTAGNPEFLYDGFHGEYLIPSPGQWAAIDLGKPVRLSRIRFIPYDIDPASIQKSDIYLLSVWDGEDWEALIELTAEKKALPLRIHPNTIYLLENKSRFVHARPFIYNPEEHLVEWW